MTPYKSTIIGLHFVALLAMVLAFLPLSVSATVPVVDDKAIGRLDNIRSDTGALVRKEYILDPQAKALSAVMLQFITRSIIGFVQQGGNTNFVSNLQAALINSADQAAGEFLNQLAGINLCSPFAGRIRSALGRPLNSLSARLSCSATGIFNNLQTSYQQFLNDFTKGGWPAYLATLNGPNNYFDALINGYDAKLAAESRRTAIVKEQYQAGNGFLGVRVKKQDCTEIGLDGNPLCNTVDVQTTPGHLVASQVDEVFNSGIQDIVNADEIGETLDKLFFFFINQLISSSLSGLASNNAASGFYEPALASGAVSPPTPALPADLLISKSPTPNTTNILAGDVITFSGSVKNEGGEAAATFSNNFQIDLNDDGTVDETLSPPPVISYLASGQEQTVTSAPWRAKEGRHRIILCADEPNSVVSELLKTNNCNPAGSGLFTVGPRPDLVISENPSIFSGAPTVGQTITFKGTVKNQGGSAAVATFQNRFQIDLNNDGTVDVTLSPSPTLANLAPNASQGVISANWTAVEGTHRVILCADEPSKTIVEADETNNCSPAGTGVFTISP